MFQQFHGIVFFNLGAYPWLRLCHVVSTTGRLCLVKQVWLSQREPVSMQGRDLKTGVHFLQSC